MSEWREFRLDELADIADCEHKTADIVESSEFYSIRTSNISNGKIDFHGSNRISFQTYQDWTKRAIPKEGDIILAREAPVGEVGMVKKGYKVCLGQRTVLLSVKNDNVDNYYLLYYLVNPAIKFELVSRSTGSVVAHLNMKDIRAFEISIPPILEQKAIAAVLSSLDDKIDLLHRQNKALEAMAETLFKQWFVVEAREDWEEMPLGDVVETTSGGTPSRSKMEYYDNGTINWVKSKELSGSFILDTEEMITEEALKSSSAKLLPANSILIAMYGATVGEYAIISKKMTCNQAVCALKPNTKYPYTFLFMFIKSNKDELINMAVGSAQQNISQLLIKQLPVLTCYKEISKFDAIVEPSFRKIRSNIAQIRTLETLRDTLLPKLMSGEVRVKL